MSKGLSQRNGWREVKLGEVVDVKHGYAFKGKHITDKATDFGFRFPQNRVYTTESKRFAEKFDTLISVRAPVGEQNMAKRKYCIGRGVASFSYKHNPNCYTYTYFKLQSLMGKIKQFNNEGTIFGSISKTDFQKMEIVLPPKKLVKQFEHEAKPINDKVIGNCTQMDTLENLRDTLMPKFMSRKARVEITP